MNHDKKSNHFHLTARDLAILEQIATLRYAKTSQIMNLFGGGSKLRRRLRILFDHGYLSRTRTRQPTQNWGGSEEIVHSLGKHGAKLLATRSPLPYGRLDWLQRHSKNESVEHGLMISEFLTHVELACENHESITFIPPFQSKERILGIPKHIAWHVQTNDFGSLQSIGIVPDEVFGLQYGNNEPVFFFFEADRGTVPITSRNMFRTSMAKKLIGYNATKESGILQNKWNLPYFKVLILTSSPARLKNLVDINCRFNDGKGSGLFLFLDQESFRNSKDILTTLWTSGYNNEGVRLDGSHSPLPKSDRRKASRPPQLPFW